MPFIIKQGDLDEPLRATLQDNGVAVDLTGYDVWFLFSSDQATYIFRRVCVVESTTLGQVRYDWQAGDTDTAGRYSGAFELVAQATGRKKTYPSEGFFDIQILADLVAAP